MAQQLRARVALENSSLNPSTNTAAHNCTSDSKVSTVSSSLLRAPGTNARTKKFHIKKRPVKSKANQVWTTQHF